MVNSTFNLEKKIIQFKVVRKILTTLSRPKVIVMEKNNDIDSIRVCELMRFLETQEMITLLSSWKPESAAFKAYIRMISMIEKSNNQILTYDELLFLSKKF